MKPKSRRIREFFVPLPKIRQTMFLNKARRKRHLLFHFKVFLRWIELPDLEADEVSILSFNHLHGALWESFRASFQNILRQISFLCFIVSLPSRYKRRRGKQLEAFRFRIKVLRHYTIQRWLRKGSFRGFCLVTWRNLIRFFGALTMSWAHWIWHNLTALKEALSVVAKTHQMQFLQKNDECSSNKAITSSTRDSFSKWGHHT